MTLNTPTTSIEGSGVHPLHNLVGIDHIRVSVNEHKGVYVGEFLDI